MEQDKLLTELGKYLVGVLAQEKKESLTITLVNDKPSEVHAPAKDAIQIEIKLTRGMVG